MSRASSSPVVATPRDLDRASASARVEAALRRVEDVEAEIRALLPEADRAGRLRREAKILDRGPASPGRGLLLGVKDIFHIDGFPTRAGSRLPAEELAGPQASSVTRLVEQGALLLGKSVTTEFAYFAPGPTRNPRNTAHTPGGSSSGSAAAVAAGLCDLALGSQTIGSILRPASFCGIVGFKPTIGSVPIDGVIPLAPSFDHVGWFAADVAGIRRAAEWLMTDFAGPTIELPRLAIPAGPYLDHAGETARAHFDRAAAALASSGIAVQTVPVMPDFAEVVLRHQTILAAEAAEVHAAWFRRHADLYHERTARLIRDGQRVPPAELAAARQAQGRLRDELESVMNRSRIDLWIAPSTVGPAPLGLESTGDPVMNLPWTQAGMPVLTLPIGLDPQGLPLGLQLVGHAGDDARLLAWATLLETILGPLADRAASR